MRRQPRITVLLVCATALFSVGCTQNEQIIPTGGGRANLRDAMGQSLVCLSVSANSYELLQPWRPPGRADKSGFACAVGPYEVLTTALNIADATFIKCRVRGQNEYVPATVKVVDYDCNLALLELDRSQLGAPLVPLTFVDRYRAGAAVDSYWLGGDGDVITGRGHLDRAEVNRCESSFTRFLDYVVSGTSMETGQGRLFCMDGQPIGIACWANSEKQEAGLAPACTINHFLADAGDGGYGGFGIMGFVTEAMTDPSLRKYLGLSPESKLGVYVRMFTRSAWGAIR